MRVARVHSCWGRSECACARSGRVPPSSLGCESVCAALSSCAVRLRLAASLVTATTVHGGVGSRRPARAHPQQNEGAQEDQETHRTWLVPPRRLLSFRICVTFTFYAKSCNYATNRTCRRKIGRTAFMFCIYSLYEEPELS